MDSTEPKKNGLQILNFILKYGQTNYDPRFILETIPIFHERNTYIILKNNQDDEVVAVCVWNNIDSDTADVQELIIHPDYRGKKNLINYIVFLGWKKFPFLKYITFKRERKYPKRERPRVYKIERFFGKRKIDDGNKLK